MAHKNRSNWSPYTARQQAKRETSGATSSGSETPSRGASGGPGRAAKPVAGTPTRSAPKSRPTSAPVGRHGTPVGAATGAQATNRTSPSPNGGRHRRSTEDFTFNEADDRIYSVFRNHGLEDYPHAKRQKLTRFYELLMENQTKENFTRLLNLKDVAIKHFIDSLIVTKHTELKYPLLDMGTGPGFPGIPLAIHSPEEKVILAEGVQRRVEFLKHARESLGLKNLPILGRNVNAEVFYPVQGVITRAVEDARNTLGNVINCLQTGGSVYLMKGPNCGPEIPVALETWGEYFELEADIAYEIPRTPNERRLLIFKKIKAAPLPDFEELDLVWERENGTE